MKEGLFFEEGELRYYKSGKLYHAGVIKEDGAIYYINSRGRAVTGDHIVHGEMTNGILKKGTYTFGEDYKLIKGSYRAPQKRKKRKDSGSNVRKRKAKWYKGKNVRWILIGIAALILCVVIAWLVDYFTGRNAEETPSVQTEPVSVDLPTFTEEVLLCSPAAKALYDGQTTAETAVSEDGAYKAFNFSYRITGTSGMLYLGEKQDLSDAQEYVLPREKNNIQIHNLKTNTTYYYKVTVSGREAGAGTFKTAASTRFIYVPSISSAVSNNMRDIGGYVNQNGRTVKQGMLIRGAEIDGLVEKFYYIDDEAAEEFQRTFGFAYDFDLRSAGTYRGEYTSRLGADVAHKFYGAPQYGEIFSEFYSPALKEIFTDLAKEENYPMYLHCTYGADRTGTIIFLLQGLLDISEKDMIAEYQRTGYAAGDFDKSRSMEVIINGLQSYEGDTLQEKIVSFLKSTGITDDQIDQIRNILLE